MATSEKPTAQDWASNNSTSNLQPQDAGPTPDEALAAGASHHSEKHAQEAPSGLDDDDDNNNNGDNNNDNSNQARPPSRSSTFKDKIKDRKQKVKDKVKPPGGFDSTPIPDAPQGYTVKFIFHGARNLPVSDYGTQSSDPFVTATLTTSLLKRHKEDPDLFFRTKTIHKTLEPDWEQSWVVANVPASGFKLKCRLYDEDWPDHDDRLGNVTLVVDHLSESWAGFPEPGHEFPVKKRAGSKRAYVFRGCAGLFVKEARRTPSLLLSAEVIGKSDPPHGHMYTVGPTHFFKHFSPMIGRMTGIKVNENENDDHGDHDSGHEEGSDQSTQKYDFQANEVQLAGPVPPKLYHRFVEFRPVIGMLFKNKGLRGKILNGALHHQHRRVYSFQKATEFGTFEPCTKEASLQFLKMVHFDQGGRIFTYVITLDGLMRFTETGKEFGIDLLSKHTMHSDAAVYIACSGEFFVRRLAKANASEDPEPEQPTHPSQEVPGGPPEKSPPANPAHYQLVIDNDSGTYRPDKSVLPDLHDFLKMNFPGLGIVTLACDDPENKKLKDEQLAIKKKEGRVVRMVANRSPSASSLSSDDVSDLEDLEEAGDQVHMSKRERALELLADPEQIKRYAKRGGSESEAAKMNDAGPSAKKAAETEKANGPAAPASTLATAQ